MDKKISEDQAEIKKISKNRNEFLGRLTNEIYDEFIDMKNSLENITIKVKYLKDFESKYNKTISDKITILIKELKFLRSAYVRDDWRNDLIN